MTSIGAIANDLSTKSSPQTPQVQKSDLVSKDTFLQLLVAQIKNQNPAKASGWNTIS